MNYSVFHTLLAFVSRRTCTFETFYPPAFISLIAACNIAAATAAAISFTVSNAKGNPFSFITFRVLFHTVSSLFCLGTHVLPKLVCLHKKHTIYHLHNATHRKIPIAHHVKDYNDMQPLLVYNRSIPNRDMIKPCLCIFPLLQKEFFGLAPYLFPLYHPFFNHYTTYFIYIKGWCSI